MRIKTIKILAGICIFALSGFVVAQTVTANQGAPGNQGAWPVTFSSVTVNISNADGGFIGTVSPKQCTSSSVHTVTSVGVAAGSVPASAAALRFWTLICNSLENTGNPLVKCRFDNTNPVMGNTNPGEVLGVGDCFQVTNFSVNIKCISDTAATAVTSYECL